MKKSILFFSLFVAMFLFVTGCEMGGGTGGNTDSSKYTLSFYDGDVLLLEEKLEAGEEIIFAEVPEKDGYIFQYWVDESGRLFPLTTMPKEDTKLYTLYEEGYSYKFLDYDGTILLEGSNVKGSTIPVPEDPVREKEGNTLYTFTGWDKEITTLEANVVYTAQYSSKEVYTLTYEIDGGNWNYYSYDDVVKALLYDYNKFLGTSYTTSSLPTGAWECINFHLFYFQGNNAKKWSWLLAYLGDNGSSYNKAACKSLSLSTSVDQFLGYNENYKYSVSYELRAFIRGEYLDSNANYPTANYANYDLQNGFWSYYQESIQDTLVVYVDVSSPRVLPQNAYKLNYVFEGWYDNPDFNGTKITSITLTGDTTLYAKFTAVAPVEEIKLNNAVSEIENLSSYTLSWEVLPSDVTNKKVKFKSSDTRVLTVNTSGVITTLSEGKATVTVTSALTPSVSYTLEITVYTPERFVISYNDSSIVEVGSETTILAQYIQRDGTSIPVTFASSDTSIATVDNGVVRGISKGNCNIIVSAGDAQEEVGITVVDGNESDIIKLIMNSHYSNILTVYNLNIGDVYNTDIIGSVNRILFNDELEFNTEFYEIQKNITSNHGGTKTSTEFITVHYTGNMNAGATGRANADYFANGGNGTSIHYVTGNDGVFYCLDESLVGYHAGDGTGTTFTWSPTGVMVKEDDPDKPVFSISENSKFTINGQETIINVPTGNTEATKKVTSDYWINKQGLSWKVIDGQYYMGTTWWCYTQVSEGRICNHGGNNNSIGIESAVNLGSDLMYTWHKTAQLVAYLVDKYDLTMDRVVGHHFFSAKNCPQPMLENNLQLWYEFIDMVKPELELIQLYENYELSMEVLTESPVLANGRVKQPKLDNTITYKVIVTNKTTSEVEEIILSSVITGQFNK